MSLPVIPFFVNGFVATSSYGGNGMGTNGGNITLIAPNGISAVDPSQLSTNNPIIVSSAGIYSGSGNAGNITITASNGPVYFDSYIHASAFGATGNAGPNYVDIWKHRHFHT